MGRLALRPALRAYAHAPAGVEEAFTNTYSFLYDAVDEYCVAGDSLISDQPYSISLWAKFTKVGANDNTYYHYFGQDITGTGWYFNRIRLYIRDHATWFRLYMDEREVGTSASSAHDYLMTYAEGNAWHHLVVTSTSTTSAGLMNMWVNGVNVLIDQAGKGYVAPGSVNPHVVIGATWSTGVYKPWEGNIDEVSIYNGVISDADIATLFNLGTPVAATDVSNCVAWWRMGDGAGDSAIDTETVFDQVGSFNMTSTNTEEADMEEDVPS